MSLKVKKVSPKAQLPKKGSSQSAGFDLYSIETKIIHNHCQEVFKTGITVQIPLGCYGRIAPRSGLAYKHQINVHAGVIDQDYRGEIMVMLFNHSDKDIELIEGERIAQLILEKYADNINDVVEVEKLDNTKRGTGGFGSTGKM